MLASTLGARIIPAQRIQGNVPQCQRSVHQTRTRIESLSPSHQPYVASPDSRNGDAGASTSEHVSNEQHVASTLESAVIQQCLQALVDGNNPKSALQTLRDYAAFARTLLEIEHNDRILVKELASRLNSEDALEALLFIKPTPTVITTSVLAFAKKDSYKAVQAMHERVSTLGFLEGAFKRDIYLAFVRAYGLLNRIDSARSTFKEGKRSGAFDIDDTQAANVLLNALTSDVATAFIRARQMMQQGMRPDISTINTLLKGCMRNKDAERAELAWKWMQEEGLEPDEVTFNCLIKAFSYGGNFEGVLTVPDRMIFSNFTPTPRIWGSLLVACGTAHQFETALMLWRQLKQLHKPIPADTYAAMMIACNACSQGERALAVLSEMKSANVPANLTVYNLAIKACESGPGRRPRQDQLWAALGLLAEMQLDAGLVPDAVTFGTLMEQCAEAKQGRVAQQLYLQMKKMGVQANTVVLTSLIKALGRTGMIDDCLQVWKSMIWGPSRLKPNRETFRTVISVLRENGALSEALKVYEGMRKARHAPSNREFQDLIAVAAETALARGDPRLQEQVASLCNVTSLSELDLHGMSSLEARAAVLCVLGILLSQYQKGQPPKHGLTIITGRGEHSSVKGEPVLRGLILKLLQSELNLSVSGVGAEQEVELQDGESNPGRLEVSEASLNKWLEIRGIARNKAAAAAAAAVAAEV